MIHQLVPGNRDQPPQIHDLPTGSAMCPGDEHLLGQILRGVRAAARHGCIAADFGIGPWPFRLVPCLLRSASGPHALANNRGRFASVAVGNCGDGNCRYLDDEVQAIARDALALELLHDVVEENEGARFRSHDDHARAFDRAHDLRPARDHPARVLVDRVQRAEGSGGAGDQA